ncbi:MAG TPA: DUF2252 domain-containing protein [Streptosporangiaceae bacterium]|jgi:uncharacterized protein (DUF2252 family)|nr:DUF2252 domain-containing protein [Streptosporangiaceae bacterium]
MPVRAATPQGAAPRIRRISHPSLDERLNQGRTARDRTPPSGHAGWSPATDRPDPVGLLEQQDRTREPDLVPVRHGRMMVSPFTFYRGAAKIMAVDLKDTSVAGLRTQLCGDAHLSNFGMFASPERRLMFDLNDFDETLPGPFEYDVKRMAASFLIAGRNNGFSKADARAAAMASVTAYREAMADFAQMPTMDVWYAHFDEDRFRTIIQDALAAETSSAVKKEKEKVKKAKAAKKEQKDPKQAKVAKEAARRAEKNLAKAHTRDSLQALSKLAELADGQYRIVSQPPVIVPARDLAATFGLSLDQVMPALHDQFRAYRATLPDDRRKLLERFQIVDAARKVVGVGSVGTRAFIVLLEGRDAQDPLFLQIKEATASVLEASLPRSRYRQHGERVVQGQRMMQAASDIFLGWTKGLDVRRHFYWRQLRDMKGSALVELMAPVTLLRYAQMCGWTLARAHARSGDPVAMAAYLGRDDAFDRSITDFSERYADRNEQDYEQFVKAIRSGRLQAVEGV